MTPITGTVVAGSSLERADSARSVSANSSSISDANPRFLALLHLFELNANDGEPGDVESIAERLVVLVAHAAVGVVDTHRPDFFASLLERGDDV